MGGLLRREPLVLFVLVGGLLYAAWAFLAPEPVEVIQIDEASLRAFEQSQADILGRPLTEAEREEIRQGIACVKHQNMAGSDIGDDHKEYFAGDAALKAGGEDNTMNQFS